MENHRGNDSKVATWNRMSYKEAILLKNTGEVKRSMEERDTTISKGNQAPANCEGRNIVLELEVDQLSLMDRCVFGEVMKVEYMEEIATFCSAEEIACNSVKYLGGLDIMLVMDSKDGAVNLINNVEHGIRKWIWKMKLWDADRGATGRLTWISIISIPVDGWYIEVFTKIAEK